jgi:hypothetical protein
MKHIKLAVVSVLFFAANGAYAAFPSDAEASYAIAASNTYADMQARKGGEQSQAWGVGKRQAPTPHNAFPFGGGPVDD